MAVIEDIETLATLNRDELEQRYTEVEAKLKHQQTHVRSVDMLSADALATDAVTTKPATPADCTKWDRAELEERTENACRQLETTNTFFRAVRGMVDALFDETKETHAGK